LNCFEAQLQLIALPQEDRCAHQRIEIDVVQPAQHPFAGLSRTSEFDQHFNQLLLTRLSKGPAIRTRAIQLNGFLGTTGRVQQIGMESLEPRIPGTASPQAGDDFLGLNEFFLALQNLSERKEEIGVALVALNRRPQSYLCLR